MATGHVRCSERQLARLAAQGGSPRRLGEQHRLAESGPGNDGDDTPLQRYAISSVSRRPVEQPTGRSSFPLAIHRVSHRGYDASRRFGSYVSSPPTSLAPG